MEKNDPSFSVYHKKNQTIKYINRESCHRAAVFKAIPAGVFTHMGRLTSITDKNKDMPIPALFPTHAAALKKQICCQQEFPPYVSFMNRNSNGRKSRN